MEKLTHIVDEIKFFVYAYALVLSCIEGFKLTRRVIHLRKTRHLRKVWGIKDNEDIILVCSELPDPEERQNVEPPREFVYNLKYGDVDAYFETVYTLLKLYPNLKLTILSCGEAKKIRMNYGKTLILIGGPDYNSSTSNFLERSQFGYRSPDSKEQSNKYPNEIVLFHKLKQEEFCETVPEKDFGYFERIRNPHNPNKYIVMIGGCHTIGVTAAVKAFSLVPHEGEINNCVFPNAKKVAKKISKKSEFAVLVNAERTNQTIHTPNVKDDSVFIRKTKNES